MQAIKHDAHLLFSRVVLPGCPPDIADKRLGRRRVSTRSVATQLEWCETDENSCLVTNKGIAAYVVRRPKTVASPGQPARLIQRQKFSAKKKNGHPRGGCLARRVLAEGQPPAMAALWHVCYVGY